MHGRLRPCPLMQMMMCANAGATFVKAILRSFSFRLLAGLGRRVP